MKERGGGGPLQYGRAPSHSSAMNLAPRRPTHFSLPSLLQAPPSLIEASTLTVKGAVIFAPGEC